MTLGAAEGAHRVDSACVRLTIPAKAEYISLSRLALTGLSHLRDLSAVHATGSYWNQFFAQGGLERLKEGMAAMGAAVHPVVARHPVTGRPFLYVNRHFTTHVLGMSSGDSQRLLTALFDHINQPDFQVRFRWHPGTVALWDNRVTQHYAVADYLPQYRCMHRVTVVNDRRSPSQ